MELKSIRNNIPAELYDILEKEITKLRPAQEKSIKKGLLEGKNLLVCTPTASGKTLIAELAALKSIIENKGKAIYIVPLKALASEKYRDFKKRYGKTAKVAMSIGDNDSSDSYLAEYDLIVTTSEKLDSLIRHNSPWLSGVKTVIVDEVKLAREVEKLQGNYVIEGHLAHFCSGDLVFVLRCSVKELRKRLEQKVWAEEKIQENVDAELMEVILSEAKQHNRHVIEIDSSSSIDQTLKQILKVVQASSL